MSDLTHRERVLMAFRGEQPDRPPMDMMGNATMLLDGTYLRLRDHLGLSPIPPVRSGSTANYYDERILEILDVDFRRVFLPRNPDWKRTTFEDGSYLDEFGVRNIPHGIYINTLEHPLQHATSVREIEAFDWPEPADLFSTARPGGKRTTAIRRKRLCRRGAQPDHLRLPGPLLLADGH